MHRLSFQAVLTLTIVLTLPLSGCMLPGQGDLVIGSGESVTKTGGIELYKRVIVESGATLELQQFDLRASDGVEVAGTLRVRNSSIEIGDHEHAASLAIRSGGNVSGYDSHLVASLGVRIEAGSFTWVREAIAAGTISVGSRGSASILDTDIATRPRGADLPDGFTVGEGASLYLRNSSIRGANVHVEEGGRARLINVGVSPTQFVGPGAGEVGWPLVVRARTVAGPAAGVDLMITSIPANGAIEATGRTGDDGIAFVEALEYVVSHTGSEIEVRNPHRVTAISRLGEGVAVVVQGHTAADMLLAS